MRPPPSARRREPGQPIGSAASSHPRGGAAGLPREGRSCTAVVNERIIGKCERTASLARPSTGFARSSLLPGGGTPGVARQGAEDRGGGLAPALNPVAQPIVNLLSKPFVNVCARH